MTSSSTQVLQFCNRTIDIGVGLKGLIDPFRSAGKYLTDHYDRYQFCWFVAQSRFRRRHARATHLHLLRHQPANRLKLPLPPGLHRRLDARQLQQDRRALALAVAAPAPSRRCSHPSSSSTNPATGAAASRPERDDMRGRLVLSDGGVYDNMGLESPQQGKIDITWSATPAPFELETDPPAARCR